MSVKSNFLICMLAAMCIPAVALAVSGGPIGGPGPAIMGGGGNLTSYTGGAGAMNNNQWNQAMNPGRNLPAADFGNCNAVIIRCAQPKCPGGGCMEMAVAVPIVNGCVQSNPSCRQYGDELIQYISAQLVANSTARAMEQDAMAQQAAAMASAQAAASAQNENMASMQMQQMQEQMMQMQQQMAMQQQEAQEQMNAALAAQMAAQQEAMMQQQATSVAASAGPSTVVPVEVLESAAERGISADIIARNQASGQILAQLENVSVAMQALRKTMQEAFEYAGCDSRGENCTGPKRVAAFKQKAAAFFDPFETVQDEVYDALIQAQALGVDISDIYMMLSSSCHVWGQYLCEGDQVLRFASQTREDGCIPYYDQGRSGNSRICAPTPEMRGKIIPLGQGGCQLIKTLTMGSEVQQNWLEFEQDQTNNRRVMVACASDALDNSPFFSNRRKRVDDVGIDDLALVLAQDAIVTAITGPSPDQLKKCASDSGTLAEILMSNRIDLLSGSSNQSETTRPRTAAEIQASVRYMQSLEQWPEQKTIAQYFEEQMRPVGIDGKPIPGISDLGGTTQGFSIPQCRGSGPGGMCTQYEWELHRKRYNLTLPGN